MFIIFKCFGAPYFQAFPTFHIHTKQIAEWTALCVLLFIEWKAGSSTVPRLNLLLALYLMTLSITNYYIVSNGSTHNT